MGPSDVEKPPARLDNPARMRAFARSHGIFGSSERVRVTFLGGGVSSLVAKLEGRASCTVIKQALPELRVRGEWRSRERSLIEARCAEVLTELVPGSAPTPFAVDGTVCAFAMSCAPAGSVTWKDDLMRGQAEEDRAAEAGVLLGRIHVRSNGRLDLAESFDDRSFFDELRLDPYLRATAGRHPDLQLPITDLINMALGRRVALVHGDFSPKNLLVAPGRPMLLIDHEVAHWGGPAFDTAFALSHLCLKALKFPDRSEAYLGCARRFWASYRAETSQLHAWQAWLEQETALMLGGLLLARIDGKSPVEYLRDEDERERVRGLSRRLIENHVADLATILGLVGVTARGVANAA
jgi:5-methylthioribose kinase